MSAGIHAPVVGDCDGNGALDVADLPALRDKLLHDSVDVAPACDANQDGAIDVADLTCMAALLNGSACQPMPNDGSILGTNLAEVADWSASYPFVDAFKSSRPWITQSDSSWNTWESDKLDLDEHGWVRSLPASNSTEENFRFVGTLMLREIDGNYPSGEYIVLYDGEGTIEYDFTASSNNFGALMGADSGINHPSTNWVTSAKNNEITYIFAAQKDETQSSPGRDVLNVSPDSNGIYLKIAETDPNGTGNYIRNIRVIMPGFEESYQDEVFHPHFLDAIENYHELRFMDWMRTNDSTQSGWADRPLPTDASFASSAGVPLETMVALANELEADPWFNMPHLATNDYIESFAALALEALYPGQKVYVEYSNEVWNSQFEQAQWVENAGIAEWAQSPVHPYQKRLNWHGKRTAEMCDIWEEAWGSQADRVICVMGAQAVNQWGGNQSLDCPLWDEAPCHDHNVDAIAIAPYFGHYLGLPANFDVVENWLEEPDGGLELLFTEIITGGLIPNAPSQTGALQNAIDHINNYADVAQERQIQMIGYEGGQHLTGIGSVAYQPEMVSLFAQANRDPRMGEIYEVYLNSWQEAAGSAFAHYLAVEKSDMWGNWGALESLMADSSPKYDAMQAFIQANKIAEAFGSGVTGTVPALSLPANRMALAGGEINLPVHFSPNGNNISSLAFTIEIDETTLDFNDADQDNDGILDGVSFNLAPQFSAWMSYTVSGTVGSLSILIDSGASKPTPLYSGEIMSMKVATPISPAIFPIPIEFGADPILARTTGLRVEGRGIAGTIQFMLPSNHIFLPIIQSQ